MKTVNDLSPSQMVELKQQYLRQHILEAEHRDPSFKELANAANLVDDWLVLDAYAGMTFSDEDFKCSATSPEKNSSLEERIHEASVQAGIESLRHHDPLHGHCVWFPLNVDKCISVWYDPDKHDGDQLLMKLEERGEDGSMGAHCEVLIDESYGTGNLSATAILSCLQEVYVDAGLPDVSLTEVQVLTDKIMTTFELKKTSLETQISSADARVNRSSSDIEYGVHQEER